MKRSGAKLRSLCKESRRRDEMFIAEPLAANPSMEDPMLEVTVNSTCPHCGYRNSHSYSTDTIEASPDLECHQCGKKYKKEDDPNHFEGIAGPHSTVI